MNTNDKKNTLSVAAIVSFAFGAIAATIVVIGTVFGYVWMGYMIHDLLKVIFQTDDANSGLAILIVFTMLIAPIAGVGIVVGLSEWWDERKASYRKESV